MASIGVNDDGLIVVEGSTGSRVLYAPRAVTLPDGTVVAHESQGGSLSSAAAFELDPFFLEIAYLGDGPQGGELVMSVSGPAHAVLLGDLWTADPVTTVAPSWPAAVDLALGLTTPDTQILGGVDTITRDELEAFHQRLLGALHG